MIDEQDLAYAAGFLDGEGCFYADLTKYCKAGVRCSNTYEPAIKSLHQLFGGHMYKEKRKKKSYHKDLYTWAVVGNDALRVCQVIAPYLKEKTEQALLLIAIQQTKCLGFSSHKRLTQNVIDERLWYSKRMRELKHD